MDIEERILFKDSLAEEKTSLISELTDQYKLAYELREREKDNKWELEKKRVLERLNVYSDNLKDQIQNTTVNKICELLENINNVNQSEYIKIRNLLNKRYLIENGKLSEEMVDNFLEEFHDHFGNNIDEFIKEDEMVM